MPLFGFRSSRVFATATVGAIIFTGWVSAGAAVLRSPDGQLVAEISTDTAGALVYALRRSTAEVILPSRIGVSIDGVDLGQGVSLGTPVRGEVDEKFPVPGVKRESRGKASTLSIPVTSRDGTAYTLEARAYDDGFAWRILLPEKARRRVTGEASDWTLPGDTRIWLAERNSSWKLKTYAGAFVSTTIEALPAFSAQGPVQCPPLVLELPGESGYAVISEAVLADYSGMRLRALGNGRLQVDFSEGAEGFVVEGALKTPWRVTLVAPDLNRLVNNDVILALNPSPDPVLFADTGYIRPGRSVWRWWSRGTGSPAEESAMIDDAAELGFEYSLIDDGWEKWPDAWSRMTELCAHGRKLNVGIFVWKNCNDVSDPADNWTKLRTFLDKARAAGVAGIKIDFFNSEDKPRVDYQRTVLRLAAERRLMVNFHGIQKPTGEARTFPNEISREGIRGLELNRMSEGPISASHNAALPFTRYVVGHGDYTPLGYSNPGSTTWAHQLATVVQGTSPLLVIGENPDMLLRGPATRPALDVLKAIPASWDETRVLAPSRIGKLAVIARRKNDVWFLAALSGAEATGTPALDLSFLDANRRYRAVIITSTEPGNLVRRELSAIDAHTDLPLELAPGDGMVCWLRPE